KAIIAAATCGSQGGSRYTCRWSPPSMVMRHFGDCAWANIEVLALYGFTSSAVACTNITGGVPGGNHWPSKPNEPPVRITDALMRGSMQHVLYAAAAAVTPPSDWPESPTASGFTTLKNNPGLAERSRIDV